MGKNSGKGTVRLDQRKCLDKDSKTERMELKILESSQNRNLKKNGQKRKLEGLDSATSDLLDGRS